MAGMSLAELMNSKGVQEGKVEQVRKGRIAQKAIDKILAKCKADIKAIDANGGKIPVEKVSKKSGKKYKAAFMWRSANEGKRQINFVVDNHRWNRFSWVCDDNAASIKGTIQKAIDSIGELDPTHKGYLEKDAKAFLELREKTKEKKKSKKKK